MPVFALWSPPRARSTAFFRSMVERGDLVALHEPFCNLTDYGETDAPGQAFDSPTSLLTWLIDGTPDCTNSTPPFATLADTARSSLTPTTS